MNYTDALKHLDSIANTGVQPGLERINLLMEKFNFPHKNYKTVHVTGTNGKGSVCAMLAEILKLDGRKVGLYTSPHLESYCERIKINGENISEKDFGELIGLVKNSGVFASHFETLTAAAFEYFSRQKVDIAVMEVGLGGIWDATNIITPEVSVITTVALDHERLLGDLESIARNKAGIIKKNVPVVTGATGTPLKIIREVAKKNNSALYEVTKPAEFEINLRGEYQKFNAAIAIQAAKLLNIDEKIIRAGLEKVQWAGRFENINGVIIDGAHNPHGAAALRQSLDKEFPAGKRVWIFGALADKRFSEMIDILFRAEDFVIVTPPDSERAATSKILCETLDAHGIKNVAVEKISDAVKLLKSTKSEIKIIAGSLYLIGAARKFL